MPFNSLAYALLLSCCVAWLTASPMMVCWKSLEPKSAWPPPKPDQLPPPPVSEVLSRVYDDNVTLGKGVPTEVIPKLLKKVRPVHELVPVDVFVPGCPPARDKLFARANSLAPFALPNCEVLFARLEFDNRLLPCPKRLAALRSL